MSYNGIARPNNLPDTHRMVASQRRQRPASFNPLAIGVSITALVCGMMLRIILVEGRLHPLDLGDYGWVSGVVLCFAVQLWLLGSKAKQLLQRSIAPLAASAVAAVGLVLWARVS